jgi:hypothetical protein
MGVNKVEHTLAPHFSNTGNRGWIHFVLSENDWWKIHPTLGNALDADQARDYRGYQSTGEVTDFYGGV